MVAVRTLCGSLLILLAALAVAVLLLATLSPAEWSASPSSPLCRWSDRLGLGHPPLPPPLIPLTPLPHSTTAGVCLLVRCFSQNYNQVHTLMRLLLHNTHVPSVFFFPTDRTSSFDDLHRTVEQANNDTGLRFGHALNISYEEALKDFPELEKGEKEYGFAYTDAAIDRVTGDPAYGCQWLLITNADNIYGGYFLDRVEQEIANGYQVTHRLPSRAPPRSQPSQSSHPPLRLLACDPVQMIGWNFISHYDWIRLRGHPQDTREGSSDDGTRRLMAVEWMEGWVDLGAVLWNASLWRSHGLNFIGLQRAKKPQWAIADGTFFMHLVHVLDVKRVIIRQTLFLHQ